MGSAPWHSGRLQNQTEENTFVFVFFNLRNLSWKVTFTKKKFIKNNFFYFLSHFLLVKKNKCSAFSPIQHFLHGTVSVTFGTQLFRVFFKSSFMSSLPLPSFSLFILSWANLVLTSPAFYLSPCGDCKSAFLPLMATLGKKKTSCGRAHRSPAGWGNSSHSPCSWVQSAGTFYGGDQPSQCAGLSGPIC